MAYATGGIRLVRDCPWRSVNLPNWCKEILEHFQCSMRECWDVGKKAASVDFDEYDKGVVGELMRIHELAAVEMLMDDLLAMQATAGNGGGLEGNGNAENGRAGGFAQK